MNEQAKAKTKAKLLLSVVIPVYNEIETLETVVGRVLGMAGHVETRVRQAGRGFGSQKPSGAQKFVGKSVS